MANTAPADAPASDTEPKKKSKLPLIGGLVGALAFGGGGFYAVYSGLLLGPSTSGFQAAPVDLDFAYVPLENMTITIGGTSPPRHLRFSGQIEVASKSHSEMMRLQPRFADVINTYLRALRPEEFTETAALMRIRAQILRRLQTIAGEGHIRDLLVTEFILN